MKLRYAVPAGLFDAGLASLASLATGAFAARFLPASELGAYALFFSAFLVAAVVPTQLVLIPAGVSSLARDPIDRIGLIGQTWHLGGMVALIAVALGTGAAALGARAPGHVLAACRHSYGLFDRVAAPGHARRTLHLARGCPGVRRQSPWSRPSS